MKEQNLFFLKYIFSIVFLAPILIVMFQRPSLQGQVYLLAGLKNQNLQDNVHSSLEEDEDAKFPTNPLELINVLRNIEAMNERTDPVDAIDNALKVFEDEDQEVFLFDRE